MKFAHRLLRQFQLVSAAMRRSPFLYYVRADTPPDIFARKAPEWMQRTLPVHDNIDQALLDGLRFMSSMLGWGNSANDLRNSVISRTCAAGNFFVYAANECKNIAVYGATGDERPLHDILARLNAVFVPEFGTRLCLEKAPLSFVDELDERIAAVRAYYLEEHGAWTQNFIDNLGDDISRVSFRNFLRQRMEAHMRWGIPAMYPIQPPAETSQWRKERRESPPPLPRIEHCPPCARDFFHLHTFIYEQYGIPGVVEALPGQCVVDAGAYIADTALYFSSKVGESGKVYAFEAMRENVDAGEANLRLNGCQNVEMVPMALSDACGELRFALNALASSGSCQSSQGEVPVKAVSLDAFARQGGIHVDFLKSDIEGGEMDMLRGAAETIRRDAPTCGLALYHKQADYHEIPRFLSAQHPDYIFYFRCEAEPVLFATVNKEKK